MSATPRNFAEWSRQVVDIHLPYNGGKQISWLDSGVQLLPDTAAPADAAAYTALLSLQSGGYGDILLAVRTATTAAAAAEEQLLRRRPGDCGGDLRDLSREETEAARAEFRGLGAQQQQRVAVLKVPKKCLSRQQTEKAFRKAVRALNELKDADIPGVSLMLAHSRQHCIEVYRYYPCDLAAAAREMRNSRNSAAQGINGGCGGGAPETFLFFWAVQLAEAVTALHERCILHCDLHPENVLLDAEGNLLLHDFGLSKRLSVAPGACGGQRSRRAAWVKIPRKFREDARQFALLEAGWWPPELAEAFRGRGDSGHMNHTVDWYGLGATLFYLRTGSYPLRHFSETQLARMLERPQWQQQQQLTPNFSHFLLQLLREKITERLGHVGDGREVLSHVCVRSSPLFRSCDSWEQRRALIRSRQLPAPYRIHWCWPEFVQRLENCSLPRLA